MEGDGGMAAEADKAIDTETSNHRLVAVSLDEASISRGNPDQEHERAIAIFDILEDNAFTIPGRDLGPYGLVIGLVENKLSFAISTEGGDPVMTHLLSLSPFRRVIRDYEMVCESYYSAIRTASPSQIEAIDMGRRGLHNEASELLKQRLDGKVDLDHQTARRLFTLVFALHWKG
ncbi:hypothetical protein HPGCJGGD_0085 [Methylobacterium haplocladii]|nr:hypothetical protein HPGCJGGD_0085 [Methylobacterium haplocladii]